MIFYAECLKKLVFHRISNFLKRKVEAPSIYKYENYEISKYIETAEKLNIKVTPLGFGVYELEKGDIKRKFMSNLCIDKENAVTYKLCGNKYLTYQMLLNNGIKNIPKHRLYKFNEIDKVCADFSRWSCPVVIKPCSGASGGKGVTVNIRNLNELKDAIAESFIFDRKNYLMEQYVEGSHFRVVTLKGDFVACSKRIPARITGNGRDSIKKIIEEENKKRSSGKNGAALYPILVDNDVKMKLKSIGKSMRSILGKDEEIYVKDIVNIHSGGEVWNVENVSDDIKSTCKKIAEILDVYLAGFDIITNDISKPLSETNGVINEVNTSVGIGSIYKVRNRETRVDIAGIVLKDMFNL